jgi:CRISPR-associated protein Cas1
MLNEMAYCPRLFFLEWVESRFVDNDDTIEGRYHHRRVDRERASSGDGQPDVHTSFLLSSERFGIIGRVDLVEFDGSTAVPVDFKRGEVPDVPNHAYEPERVQVCAQALLLREEGFVCDEGAIWFAGSRRRVRVVIDDQLVERTLELIEEARRVAAEDAAPVPLVDSPKCPRCSLVGLCLPDEMNLLRGAVDDKPRRILPRNPSPRPVYVTEPGSKVGRERGVLVVRRDGELQQRIRLIDVAQLCLFGRVQVSSQAMHDLLGRGIPVAWFTSGGWLKGVGMGLPSGHVELRRRQVALAGQGFLDIAKPIVRGKIRNQRTLLRRNSDVKPEEALRMMFRMAERAAKATSVEELLGIEGMAAKSYFGEFGSMLSGPFPGGAPFAWEGRNRRPARDPINAMLSFVYALLVKDLTAVTHLVGFDPFLGFYHRPRFGRPALALDLAEEFRPLVGDSTVITLVNNGEIRSGHFVERMGEVALTGDGRRKVIRAYERRLDIEVRHPLFGYRISYRRLLDVQARLLGAHVLGEVDSYHAFETR